VAGKRRCPCGKTARVLRPHRKQRRGAEWTRQIAAVLGVSRARLDGAGVSAPGLARPALVLALPDLGRRD